MLRSLSSVHVQGNATFLSCSDYPLLLAQGDHGDSLLLHHFQRALVNINSMDLMESEQDYQSSYTQSAQVKKELTFCG